jgi:hypothetical protein
MDDARGARLPLAKGFRLRVSQARWNLFHVMGRWVKVPTEELGWSLIREREGLSGLPHHTKLTRSVFGESW